MTNPSRLALSGLRMEILPGYEDLSRRGAAFIAGQVRARPSLLLCAATGATPTGAYTLLAETARQEPPLFDALRVVKLDEWGDLPMDDPGACETYLHEHLLGPLGIPANRYLGFRSDAAHPELECDRVQEALQREGPIDLCVLGLGVNGHLGMNEPGETLTPRAHVARLHPQTRSHTMIRHLESPPAYGMTLGMADLLQARALLLLVSGISKREVLQSLLEGGISTSLPASFLHLHPNVTLLCDRDAAGKRATGQQTSRNNQRSS